jgi:hypothetical protein
MLRHASPLFRVLDQHLKSRCKFGLLYRDSAFGRMDYIGSDVPFSAGRFSATHCFYSHHADASCLEGIRKRSHA